MKIAGAEALCRWIHNGRFVLPGEFIPVLEQGRDICKLDFYMLAAAVTYTAAAIPATDKTSMSPELRILSEK